MGLPLGPLFYKAYHLAIKVARVESLWRESILSSRCSYLGDQP